MRKLNYKRILKDIICYLILGYIVLCCIFGELLIIVSQFPLKYIIAGALIIALVCYVFAAAFKGFKMGYIIKPEETEGAYIGPVVMSEEEKKAMFKNFDNLHQEEQEENP